MFASVRAQQKAKPVSDQPVRPAQPHRPGNQAALQRLAAADAAPSSVHDVLARPGQRLDSGSRAFFEPRFGASLGDVRIHADAEAAASARAVNARAYTVGRKIAFADGEYQPGTPAGRQLMAHELAHVLQQGAMPQGAPKLQRAEAPAALNWGPSINLGLKPITDTHPLVTTAQKLGLQELDTMPASAWSGLTWAQVSTGAAQRILQPKLINQKILGLCGPAAAVNAEAVQDPQSYAKLVASVFATGKVNGHAVNDKLKGGTPLAGMDQSDWMLMSALQDVNNAVMNYYGTGDADEKRVRDSHTTGQVENDMTATGAVATKTYTCYVTGEIDAATKASDLLRAHPAEIEVVMFVSAGILAGTAGAASKPNHFIRLLEPMTITEANVTFKAFTWGDNHDYNFPVDQFKHLVSAFVVGSRNKGIPL